VWRAGILEIYEGIATNSVDDYYNTSFKFKWIATNSVDDYYNTSFKFKWIATNSVDDNYNTSFTLQLSLSTWLFVYCEQIIYITPSSYLQNTAGLKFMTNVGSTQLRMLQ